MATPAHAAAEQLDNEEIPETWTEGTKLNTASGRKVDRFGSTKRACMILDNCDRQVIYDLLASGQIAGYKNNPAARNSHFKVDLLSVWRHKERQISAH
jgi:hypothetical protein